MSCALVDQKARCHPVDGVGEQCPKHHCVAPSAAKLGDRGIPMSVYAYEDGLDRHVSHNLYAAMAVSGFQIIGS